MSKKIGSLGEIAKHHERMREYRKEEFKYENGECKSIELTNDLKFEYEHMFPNRESHDI